MPIDFNREPYYDDFSTDDNYYRLLFRPGRAVQARELTQIQTLLQSQISRLGSHLFKDGSIVTGGRVSYDRSEIKYLAVEPTFEGSPVRLSTVTPGLIIGKPAGTQTTGARAGLITGVIQAEDLDPDTIYFKWIGGEPDSVNTDGFLPGELLAIYDKATGISKYRVKALNKDSNDNSIHYGTSAQISVDAGIYYWKGMFIQAPGGSLVLSKYTADCTYRIGYMVKEESITNDPKTLDPASNYSNYSAPGADRYKITLRLVKIGDGLTRSNENVTNFMEIGEVVNGNFLVTAPNAGQDIYNQLGERLARRTFEESGNYVAQRYNLQLKNKTTKDNPIISAHMDEGVAYVGGYRHSLNRNSAFDIKKGRDTINETIDINNSYGDNYLIVYDEADVTNSSNKKNANGVFVVGSGAGQFTSSDDYGQRGAAVSIHSVPKDIVETYGLTDQFTWNSTLIGTARPTQFVYDHDATLKANDDQNPGYSYDLYLSDYKSANIANVVSVDNAVQLTQISSNADFINYGFSDRTHGITTGDRVSISGSSFRPFNVDSTQVHFANSTFIVLDRGTVPQNQSRTDGGTLFRTTGNVSPTKSVVLDVGSSAPWNGSYIGATIRVGNNSPRKIIDYIGTNSEATANYSSQVIAGQTVGWAKAGTVIVDKEFDFVPVSTDSYTLNIPMSQARSVVYNQNISATGENQYPAILNQSWDVDTTTGVTGASKEKRTSSVYGGRVDGTTRFDARGNAPEEDTLLFDVGRTAVKSVVTHGTLSGGLSGNTEFYYTEYSTKAGDGSTTLIEFAPAAASEYKFFDRPTPYPYSGTAITDKSEIKKNFILVNQTTGQVITDAITQVQVNTSTKNIAITSSGVTYTAGHTFILLYTVKVTEAKPAYKRLVKANTTYSGKTSEDTLTDYANGHVLIAKGTYGNVAGSRFAIGKPDVFKIHKVIHDVENSGVNGENGDIANTQLDITSRFILDTGQRDSFYDNASLILKTDVNAPTGNVLIIFDRFERVDNPKGQTQTEELDSPGFFSVDSYQYTTDLTLDHSPGQSWDIGMELKANNGTTGYILEYSNTAGYVAKVRLQDVRGRVGVTNPAFVVGETVTGYTEAGSSVSGEILSVVEADVKYSEIPEYKSPGGKIYPLRNMIDARPYVVSNNRVSDTIADSMTPFIPTAKRIEAGRTSASPTNPMTTQVVSDSFAGRIDKIIVTADGDYKSEPGVPAFQKYPPKDRPDKEALTLFTINIPPYTFDPRDVQIKENPAMRHTMQDIGRLAKRVENLEYYVSLDMLEKQMSELDVVDENGFSRFKNGIIVDNFNNDKIMSKQLSSNSSVSIGSGELRPKQLPYTYGRISFTPHTTDKTTVHNRNYDSILGEVNDDGQIIMLDYTTDAMITQPLATTSESVNPFDIQNFDGFLSLSPDVDHWIDTTKIPEYSSLLNTIFEVITELSEENSTTEEITNAILTQNDFWNDVSGEIPLGDNITSTGVHFETPTQSGDIERDIELGVSSVDKAKYWVSAELDAAIATHGMTDGMTRNMKILPYIRSRDIIVRAEGLKPNHRAALRFDGVGVENHFTPATEIYIEYPPTSDPANLLQPSIDGKYEKIKLTGSTFTANAILLAIREPQVLDDPALFSDTSRYMVGYIVPDIDEETGLIDYSTYKDGYYDTTVWSSDTNIRQYGWQGTNARTIEGYKSGASFNLITQTDATDGKNDYYNGHYSGTARNSSSNTTHIILSPDGHRFVQGNFRKGVQPNGFATGYPHLTYITITSGTGAGQQAIANTIIDSGTDAPIIELRSTASGGALTTGIDSTSVYSIHMKSVSPFNGSRYAVAQIGDTSGKTNHYGEKFGILQIPSEDRVKFTTGRKLVEVADRYSDQAWLVSSYASAYYEAAGQSVEKVSNDVTPDRLNLLKEIRSKVGAFKLNDHPDELGYIPARNAGQEEYGRLGVVTGVTIANGTWTAFATDGVEFRPGDSEFGTVNNADQDLYRDRFFGGENGIWRKIKENYPEVYEQYYRGYFDQWLLDEETPDQDS